MEKKEASPLAYCHHGCIDVKLRHMTQSSRENLDGTSAEATGALADIQFRTDLFPHMKGCIYTTWVNRPNSDFCFRLKRHRSEFQHKRVSRNKAREFGYCTHRNQAAFGQNKKKKSELGHLNYVV